MTHAATARSDGALTREEAARRPLAGGMLAAIVLSTIALVGAVFTFGAKWGGADASSAATAAAAGERVAQLSREIVTLGDRLRTVEEIKGGLAPAVALLAAQTERLASTVAGVRENMAAQTAELRNLKESVDQLRVRVDGARGPEGPK